MATSSKARGKKRKSRDMNEQEVPSIYNFQNEEVKQNEEDTDPSSWKEHIGIPLPRISFASNDIHHFLDGESPSESIAEFWLPSWHTQKSNCSTSLNKYLMKIFPWGEPKMIPITTKFTIAWNEHGLANPRTAYPFFKMIKNLALGETKGKNCVFSPCSIQLALSLLANTAKDSTLTKLLSFLEAKHLNHLNLVAAQVFNNLAHLYDFHEKLPRRHNCGHFVPARKPCLSFVCGIWIDQSLPLNPYFKTVSEPSYEWKTEVVDLQNQVQGSEFTPEVNNWAEKASYGLIKSVLPKNSLAQSTRLLLTNALYFRKNWSELFDKACTSEYKFHLLDDTYVEVPFVTTRNDQVISTFNYFKIIRLLYNEDLSEIDKNISMYIILPNEDYGIWRLVEKIGSDPLFFEKYECTPGTLVTLGRVRVPKFKITYEFEPCEILKENGFELPFFEEMEFYHKSHIEVDDRESGSDGCVSVMQGESHLPQVEFVADHPFLFLVRNDFTGTILLMGHVINPLL